MVPAKQHVLPEFDLMIAAQTLAWLYRYKKILNSMPKNHHMFMLHCLLCRRYNYICHRPKKEAAKTRQLSNTWGNMVY